MSPNANVIAMAAPPKNAWGLIWFDGELGIHARTTLRDYHLRLFPIRSYPNASDILSELPRPDALQIVICDLRTASVDPDCDTRSQILDVLLKEHALTGGHWPTPIVVVDRQQTDPEWLQRRPLFQRMLGDPDGYIPVVLSDWNDGAWQGLLDRAIQFRLGMPQATGELVTRIDSLVPTADK